MARYWVGGTGTWVTGNLANWSDSSGGAGGQTVPDQYQDVIFDNLSGGGIITLSGTGQVRSLVATTFTGEFRGSSNIQIVGSNTGLHGSGKSLEWGGAGMIYAYTGVYTITAANGSGSINFNGKIHSGGNITFNAGTALGPTAQWSLANNIVTSGTLTIAINAGTLTTNNYNITTGRFDIGGAANVKVVNLGSSIVTLTNISGTFWGATTTSNATINPGTSTIRYNAIPTATISFLGGGLTYNNVEIIRGSSVAQLTVTGDNTFYSFTDATSTAAHTISFATGSTQTFENFNVSGASTSARILLAGSAGATVNFVKTGAGPVICDYLNLSTNITSVTPANTWYAGYNSIGTGAGWVLRNPLGLLTMGVGG